MLKEGYTTQEKREADAVKKPEDRTDEDNKTLISNDAYAICLAIELMSKRS